MKSTRLLTRAFFSVAVWSSSLTAQTSFEGIVESKNTTTDETGSIQRYPMTMWVTREAVRISISAFGTNPGSTIIYRHDQGIAWMLNDQEKTYFEIRQPEQSPDQKEQKPQQHSDVKRTGKRRTILGYPCDQLVLRTTEVETEYWGTKKLAALSATIARAIDNESAEVGGMSDELAAMGYFPLIARTKLEGREVESTEVTKIVKQRLDPALFEIHAGYKKQSAQNMMDDDGR